MVVGADTRTFLEKRGVESRKRVTDLERRVGDGPVGGGEDPGRISG